ncbi:hypothetical protein CEXT_89081 [Caerostris extrusa]|uniref:Uncharacterized protein n=1 Tax=Caerostris extrusa TaxID=172846 RepID=A0AAV4T076_CAEEX|nr:hypothetical protein CEXT_89081 [Caerostris extrusa]
MEVTITTVRQSVKRGKMSRDLCFFPRPHPHPHRRIDPASIANYPSAATDDLQTIAPLHFASVARQHQRGKKVGRLAASRSIKKPFASLQNTVVSVSGDTPVVSQRFCLSKADHLSSELEINE